MDASCQTQLTPEQLAAVNAGGGLARVEDPSTRRVVFLVEQSGPPAIDDAYVRQQINEAYSIGGVEKLDMAAVKAEFWRRQAAKSHQQ